MRHQVSIPEYRLAMSRGRWRTSLWWHVKCHSYLFVRKHPRGRITDALKLHLISNLGPIRTVRPYRSFMYS